jgi:elongation factor Ts
MEVSMDQVKELRKATGAGILDCKKALAECQCDMEKAVDFLRKKGLAAAAKRVGRSTDEGIVSVIMSDDGKMATMLSVMCETDFVALTDEFKILAKDLSIDFSKNAPLYNGGQVSEEIAGKYSEQITRLVSKIGENIQLGDYCKYEAAEKGHLFHYVHHTGKIGVVLELECEKTGEALQLLGKNICLHIAALAPDYVDKSDVPETVIEKEKEIYVEQLKTTGKPQNVLEKIAEGKLQKFFEDRCLLLQNYALDQSLSIKQMVSDAAKEMGQIKILRFFRAKIGE